MAGYSGTPLVKKLGIKEGFRLVAMNAPDGFMDLLEGLPDGLTWLKTPRAPLDFAVIFVKNERDLQKKFPQAAAVLAPVGMIWVAWPKKSAGVPTDLVFENVQRIGLDTGLVDVKICAIDDTWSGLKFVIRVKDRKKE